ncbi:sortase [Rubrobacter indicoceani]|uniref:sortase n=1 Tax=Rubrobacter indicoceani TaxID=2051957 RepID=UPI0013C47D4F|nr:sortase [Rubrobacter indicoceani]
MGKRYSRSGTFRYKRRRQRVGLALFSSLVICVLAGLLFFGIEPYSETAQREPVQRAATPTIDSGPEAINTQRAAEAREAAAAPEVVAVPDIPYNATEEEAREMLQANGLELGDITREANEEYDEGGVFLQDPLPNAEVEEGSEVGITLSDGPPPEPEGGEDVADPATQDLSLTVPKMGLYGDYVANATDEATLMNGAGKITETGFPWQPSANTYIASHVYGYEGTGSWQHFAALPSMTFGDEIILSDADGTEYVYEVTNIITVMPTDTWITEPVAGKDMVSLQTCVGPGWSERLVVQGERVDVVEA